MFRRTAGPYVDIRQESTRHTEALGELTATSVSGDYSWSEADKQAFLIPRTELQTSASAAQLATKRRNARSARYLPGDCRSAAEGSIAAYLISMAKTPSDVLAVHLPAERSGYRVCDAGCSAV